MDRVTVSLPAISLKPIVAVHFILTVWGCQVFNEAYALSNFLVLAVGMWAIANTESTDAAQMFLFGLLFTILNDIIMLAVFYKDTHWSYTRFCVGVAAGRMAILSLILKPLSCLFIFQSYRTRGGGQLDYQWTGNPYVTIEGHSSEQAPPNNAPPQS